MLAGMLGNQMANIGANALGISSPGDLYLQALQSATVEKYLIDRFDLRKQYKTRLYIDARKRLEANTEANSDRKSGIITVTVTARSPQLAADLAKAYVDELNTVMTNLNNSAARRERLFLESRLKEVSAGLERDSLLLSQFSSKNSTLDVPEQAKAMMTAADLLEGQEIAAESELAGLQQIYAPDNARVRAEQARVEELRQHLQGMHGATDSSEANGFPSLRALPLLGVRYSDLLRKVKVQEAVFETLSKEYEMAKVDEAKDVPPVRVLDPADFPEWKSKPHRATLAIAGALLAGVLASFWVLAQNWWAGVDPDSMLKQSAGTILCGAGADLSRIPGLGRLGAVMGRSGAQIRSGAGR